MGIYNTNQQWTTYRILDASILNVDVAAGADIGVGKLNHTAVLTDNNSGTVTWVGAPGSASAGAAGGITAGAGAGAGNVGGTVTLTGGAGITNGAGGNIQLTPGDSPSGTPGSVLVGADAAGHDVTFYGATSLYKVWWDANLDTNGSWIFGADTKGVDVLAYGVTTGCYLQWDTSADQLKIVRVRPTLTGVENCTTIDYSGTFDAGTEGMVGFRIDIRPDGTGYATATGGLQAIGLFSRVVVSTPAVTGYMAGLEADVTNTTTYTGAQGCCEYFIAKLANRCTITGGAATMSPRRAFICLRDASTAGVEMHNLFLFQDEAVATAHDADRMLVETHSIPAVSDTNYVMIRCMVGPLSTPIWLIATTVAPTAS